VTAQEPDSPQLVRDLMTVGVTICAPETPVIDLARSFLEKDLEAVVVMEDGHALGVVGQEELVQAYSSGEAGRLKAGDILREGVLQIPPDIPLPAAAQIMLDQGVRAFFLMHHAGGIEYPAALITFRHFLRHMVATGEADLQDLGIKASRQSPIESFNIKRQRRHSGLPG
jgi:predicted transcriptional regulator